MNGLPFIFFKGAPFYWEFLSSRKSLINNWGEYYSEVNLAKLHFATVTCRTNFTFCVCWWEAHISSPEAPGSIQPAKFMVLMAGSCNFHFPLS